MSVPVVNSIFDISSEALGQLRSWLEQNPPAIPVTQIVGYQTNAVKVYKRSMGQRGVILSAAETVMVQETIPAGVLSTTGAIRVTIANQYLNTTGVNQTLTLRIKFGSTTVFGHAFTTTSGSPSYPMNLVFTIQNRGLINSNFLEGVIYSGSNGTLGSVAGIFGTGTTWPITSNGPTAVDTSISQDIVFTAQLGAADSNLSFSRDTYVVEIL